MNTLQGPAVLEQPFCASGDKNTIPSAATGSQLASLAEGFPEVTQKAIAEGGIPPERKDFNGALNLMSQFYYAFQNGWLPTFDQDVSDTIGGYAEGAVLWYMPSTGTYANQVVALRSLVGNNTYNFNQNASYIGTYWGVVDITTRADTSLSNLTATGKNIGNWSTNVTNCITAIPQDITLTLSGGTLTLKSGSKVYVPNGSGVFDETTITSDKTATITTNRTDVVFIKPSTSVIYNLPVSLCFSGTTAPTFVGNYAIWYDTTNNVVKFTSDAGSTWVTGLSLPLGVVTSSATAVTEIKQVFNGVGYIGSSAYILPGVKGQSPKGRESDGTLNNTAWETTSVTVVNLNDTYSFNNADLVYLSVQNRLDFASFGGIVVSETAPTLGTYYYWYQPSTNKTFYKAASGTDWSEVTATALGKWSATSGIITAFSSNTVFRSVDYNEYQARPHIIETYHNGSSWYRVWSDGWCEQGGDLELGTNSYTFQKAYTSAPKVFIQKYTTDTRNTTNAGGATLNAAPTTTGFSCYSDGVSATYWAGGYWEAKGYVF